MSKRTSNGSFSDENPPKATKIANRDVSFLKPWKGSDAVLVVEDKELHVHTNILSISSKYFESMFNGNFKEAQTKRVDLPGKSYDVLEHVLKLIYNLESRFGKLFSIKTPSPFLELKFSTF